LAKSWTSCRQQATISLRLIALEFAELFGAWHPAPEAERTLPRGRDVDDYRELLLGQDISFAWHHLQLWAECYETRFEVPRLSTADTLVSNTKQLGPDVMIICSQGNSRCVSKRRYFLPTDVP
jgi:hypothetical protein